MGSVAVEETATYRAGDRDGPGAYLGPVVTKLGPALTKRVGPGEMLFCEGEPSRSVFQIMSGAIKSYRVWIDGRTQVTGFSYENDLMGWHEGEGYGLSAEACIDSVVRIWPRVRLEAMAAHQRGISQSLWKASVIERNEAHMLHAVLGRKLTMERFAWFLLTLLERNPARLDNGAAPIPMARRDIADYISLSTETVSRCFTRLRNLQIIDTPQADQLLVLDTDRLRSLAVDQWTVL